MARYKGPACRLCRREGTKLYLKSDRCYSPKCALERRAYAPGQHGQSRKKLSEYGLQLRAKQSVRRIYGVLERPFRNYFKEADRQKGITGENLLILLERRLDNVVYRMGFATTRNEARQLVRHGHFHVNGHKMNVPSYLVKVGDEIVVREKSKSSPKFKELKETSVPEWLSSNLKELSGKVESYPARDNVTIPVDEQLIVELYSR